MKKIIFAILLALLLTPCAGWEIANHAVGAVLPTECDTWPENQYTDNLPVPPGTVQWTMVDEKHSYCAANLTGLTEEDFQNYMDSLDEDGFSVVETVSEEFRGEDYVSTGTLLSNGEKNLSIAYIPDNMTISISLP